MRSGRALAAAELVTFLNYLPIFLAVDNIRQVDKKVAMNHVFHFSEDFIH